MTLYPLPLNFDEIASLNKEDSIIDMSSLNFPCDKESQKRSSFLFIRNTNLDFDFTFERCAYEDKEEFLLLYLQGKIAVNLPLLATSWLEILLSPYSDRISLPSILNKDEIQTFRSRNQAFINELYQFIISIPVYHIFIFYSLGEEKDNIWDPSEFQNSNYEGISLSNFSALTSYDDFILLIQPIEEFQPLFYSKYFQFRNRAMDQILNNLPYLGLLNVMLASPEIQDQFVEGLNEMLTAKEVIS